LEVAYCIEGDYFAERHLRLHIANQQSSSADAKSADILEATQRGIRILVTQTQGKVLFDSVYEFRNITESKLQRRIA
jgi:hypothetical protein